MPRAHPASTLSRCPQGRASSAWWLARWLFVLVVAFDFLSAPFHHHRHDGLDVQIGFATSHAVLDDGGTHAEEQERSVGSHATTAIRIDPSRLAQLPPIDNGQAQIARVSVAQLLAAVNELPPHRWRPDRSRPDVRSHRSLPPAGRAPPLHA